MFNRVIKNKLQQIHTNTTNPWICVDDNYASFKMWTLVKIIINCIEIFGCQVKILIIVNQHIIVSINFMGNLETSLRKRSNLSQSLRIYIHQCNSIDLETPQPRSSHHVYDDSSTLVALCTNVSPNHNGVW